MIVQVAQRLAEPDEHSFWQDIYNQEAWRHSRRMRPQLHNGFSVHDSAKVTEIKKIKPNIENRNSEQAAISRVTIN
jgi:hypothetical protein